MIQMAIDDLRESQIIFCERLQRRTVREDHYYYLLLHLLRILVLGFYRQRHVFSGNINERNSYQLMRGDTKMMMMEKKNYWDTQKDEGFLISWVLVFWADQ